MLKLTLEGEQIKFNNINNELTKYKEKLQNSHELFIKKESKINLYQEQLEEHCENQQNEIDSLKLAINEVSTNNIFAYILFAVNCDCRFKRKMLL